MVGSTGTLHQREEKHLGGIERSGHSTLRLLFVTPRYLPFTGGVENHVYQVSRRLVAAGVDVTVLTTDPVGYLIPYEVVEGVQVRRVRAWPSERDYAFAPDIYRLLTGGRWDMVHVQSYHTLVAPTAMLASLRVHIPYVLTFHGGGHSSRLRNALRGAQQVALRPLLARAARLVALAKFEIEYLSRRLHLPRGRFALIPNGAEIVAGRANPKRLSAPLGLTDDDLIVSIGRLERYKGHQRILAAMPFILEHRPQARLWIAGSGPYEPELRRLANQLGVAAHVEIRAIPAGERELLAAELSRAALVTLLSEYETQPIAVLEALALGRSVLVADTSGMREMAEQKLVRAIPLQSTPQVVAMAVLNQLQAPWIPPRVELPTWDACASQLLELYESIVTTPQCVS